MPIYTNQAPGLFIEELKGHRTIQPVPTSVAAFVGQAPNDKAHLNEVFFVNNLQQFRAEFAAGDNVKSTWLSHAVFGFFQNRGGRCAIVNLPDSEPLAGSDKSPRSGLKLLEENDEVSIVAAPGRFDPSSHEALISHCESMGNRFAILDLADIKNTELLKTVEAVAVPSKGKDKDAAAGDAGAKASAAGGARPRVSPYAATYFPWIAVPDALSPTGVLVLTPPSGHIAGVYARTDLERGVHKAPANTSVGAVNLSYRVTSAEQAGLNQAGINCIRWFTPEGSTVWGCRTLAELGSEWTYVNVRRLLIFIEESIKRNMRWAVFEPNDRTLWKSVRSEISRFLTILYRDGALMGATPEEAFFVKCDEETNLPELIDLGQLTTVIGVAPVKPAEFIVFKIGQTLGGAQVEAL